MVSAGMFEAGQAFTFTTAITNDDVRRAALVSEHLQPLHHDSVYAERTHFGRPIVPDSLIVGRVTGLLEARLVDPHTHYVVTEQVDAHFTDPVFVGDQLTVQANVDVWNGERGRLTVSVEVKNQEEHPVLTGTTSFAVFALTPA